MDKTILNRLLQVKEYPCVSILLPAYRTAPDNQKTAIRLKNLVKQASENLENELRKKNAKPLIDKIKQQVQSIDISRTLDGLAIYVSKEIEQVVHIPFRVRERVIIDKTFATRDLIMGVNRGTSYYTLDLSLHRARLLQCFRDEAREVTDNGFPLQSDFPMLDLNPTDFSKEKEKQIKEFFNRVDKVFMANYHSDNVRLVIAGVQKNLAMYREIADTRNIIFGQLEGNFESYSAHDLGKRAWEVVKEKNRQIRHGALDEIQKATGAHKVASGITDVWQLANDGRISLLIAEQDYEVSAGIEENHSLVLDTSNIPLSSIIPDVIDEVAEAVLERGGRVVFVDEGSLSNHQKIAAVLRY